MNTRSVTFDSTQDISRHPVIIAARNRHFEMERAWDEIMRKRAELCADGYHELANTYLSCAIVVFNMRFL